MELTITELSQLNELILSCTNTITCMSLFRKQVQDAELKSLLDVQFPQHVEDYNKKVEFVKDLEKASGKLGVPNANLSIFQPNGSEQAATVPVTVNTNVETLNDREIANSYLLTLKRAGKEYAVASMEASNPKLRQFLKDAYTMCCNHAYEIWEWLAKNNFYALNVATGEQIGKVASIYNPISL